LRWVPQLSVLVKSPWMLNPPNCRGLAPASGQTITLSATVTSASASRRRRHSAPFAQGLVGVVHGFDAPFPTHSGSTTGAANALAALVGGGLDISINHYLAVRPIQADYGFSQLPNSIKAHQNLFRYSAGIVLRTR
jgi:hypothetical protein